MSFHIVYTVAGGEPADGDHVATLSGWDSWSRLAVIHGKRFPESHYLAVYGELFPARAVDALELELEEMVADAPRGMSGPVVSVARSLLAAVRARPDGTVGLIVTDGTEPSEGASDDDE